MPKPYDATTRYLVESSPADWPRLLGLPDGPVSLEDSNLSTVTAEADGVLRVGAAERPYLLHLEFQTGPDARLLARLHRYSGLLWYEYDAPVYTVLVLFRPIRGHRSLTGYLELNGFDSEPLMMFRYRVLRVWEEPAETFLSGGLGLLPLAPVANVRRRALPGVIEQMKRRVAREGVSGDAAARLWTAAYILMGIKYDEAVSDILLRGVIEMRESVTYQKILSEGRAEGIAQGRAEGRAEEARTLLLRLGERRLGSPSEQVRARVEAVESRQTLEDLSLRLLEVETWDELLKELDSAP
jgi:predicted transposase YdaD